MPDPKDDFVVVDTQVISWFTKRHAKGNLYLPRLEGRRIALSYVVQTELEDYAWGPARQERLRALILQCLVLPMDDATRTWFNIAKRARENLSLKSRVDDNDLWIIAQAGEHALPLMSDDRGAVTVAQAMGLDVITFATPLNPDPRD